MVCLDLLFLFMYVFEELVHYLHMKCDSVPVCLQPSLCTLLSLNNTNENRKTHILTSAVSWSRVALCWLHSCAVWSSLEVWERKLKLLMQHSSIPQASQTQNKDCKEEGDDCPAFFRYVKNSSVRVVSLPFDLSKYSLYFDNSLLSTFLPNKCTKKMMQNDAWTRQVVFQVFQSCYQDNTIITIFFFFPPKNGPTQIQNDQIWERSSSPSAAGWGWSLILQLSCRCI